jgi:hypothetical protein
MLSTLNQFLLPGEDPSRSGAFPLFIGMSEQFWPRFRKTKNGATQSANNLNFRLRGPTDSKKVLKVFENGVARIKVGHTRAVCAYCEGISGNWRMRISWSYHYCFRIRSVCVHARVSSWQSGCSIAKRVAIEKLTSAAFKCAALSYADGEESTGEWREIQDREHINLRSSADITIHVVY